MHRACTRLRQRNPNLFIVESLFANNEQGAWYDPSDMNTLFQDDAGTIPVTASGQTVGRMLDKSGQGHHAIQSVLGSRPIFRDVDGLRFLEFDGTDDFLSTNTIDLTGTDKLSMFAGIRKLSDAAIGAVFTHGTSPANAGEIELTAPYVAAAPGLRFGGRSTAGSAALSGVSDNMNFPSPISIVISASVDYALPAGSEFFMRLNAATAPTYISPAEENTGTFGNKILYIGRRGGTTLAYRGNLYGLILRSSLSDSATVSATERYIAAKTGVTLA